MWIVWFGTILEAHDTFRQTTIHQQNGTIEAQASLAETFLRQLHTVLVYVCSTDKFIQFYISVWCCQDEVGGIMTDCKARHVLIQVGKRNHVSVSLFMFNLISHRLETFDLLQHLLLGQLLVRGVGYAVGLACVGR